MMAGLIRGVESSAQMGGFLEIRCLETISYNGSNGVISIGQVVDAKLTRHCSRGRVLYDSSRLLTCHLLGLSTQVTKAPASHNTTSKVGNGSISYARSKCCVM